MTAPAQTTGELVPVAWRWAIPGFSSTWHLVNNDPATSLSLREDNTAIEPLVRLSDAAAAIEALTAERDEAQAEARELSADICELNGNLQTAERQIEKLTAALEPFATEADNWADTVPDNYRSLCVEPGAKNANPGSETAFTVGDLRRARAALEGQQ